MEPIVISGIGIEIPGIKSVNDLMDAIKNGYQPGELDYESKLGKKGSKYKNKATKLALCAANEALISAKIDLNNNLIDSDKIGVIVSSNLGNVDTVCNVVQTIKKFGTKELSIMDLPNASANIISSSIAIRFGFNAINLTICNGATSGIDAIYTAANAIHSKRAEQIIVVGCEAGNRFTNRLVNDYRNDSNIRKSIFDINDTASAIILESKESFCKRDSCYFGEIGEYFFGYNEKFMEYLKYKDSGIDAWILPKSIKNNKDANVDMNSINNNTKLIEIESVFGETYGAQGVLQCIIGSQYLEIENKNSSIITNGGTFGDTVSSLELKYNH